MSDVGKRQCKEVELYGWKTVYIYVVERYSTLYFSRSARCTGFG